MSTRIEQRGAPIDMEAGQFRACAHALVDQLSDVRDALPLRRSSPGKSPAEIRALLGSATLPEEGCDPDELLAGTLALLGDNLTYNGHPRFLAYITSSPAPIGILGDLIVSTLNPNLGLWSLSPMATEIEEQTTRWIAQLLGFPAASCGVMSSGGQTANHIGFLAARQAKTPWDVRSKGAVDESGRRLRVYTSTETHGWVKQAADMFGLGTDSLRWIPTDADLAMDTSALRAAIAADAARGDIPMMVVGTAGSVGTGAIDPLPEIAEICREHDVWFHVDGAYGACAAALPDAPAVLAGLREADSVAVDPHKWLYAPIDAGCTLVRNPKALRATFRSGALYYMLDDHDEGPVNLYEHGPENSRRFRSLKVWLALRQIGAAGYRRLISEDIALSQYLFDQVGFHSALEPWTQGLSITTFRYVPIDLRAKAAEHVDYLNHLNRELLALLQSSGEAFISHTTVRGAFLLRACVVNFRTTADDLDALVDLVARLGAEVDRARLASTGTGDSHR